MGSGIFSRRVAGKAGSMISNALEHTKINTPAIRSSVAKAVRDVRSGVAKNRFVTASSEGRIVHFEVQKRGGPITVSTMKTTGRGSKAPGRGRLGAIFTKSDGKITATRYKTETIASKSVGGEGSRGGVIIGHTRSGNPIYRKK